MAEVRGSAASDRGDMVDFNYGRRGHDSVVEAELSQSLDGERWQQVAVVEVPADVEPDVPVYADEATT